MLGDGKKTGRHKLVFAASFEGKLSMSENVEMESCDDYSASMNSCAIQRRVRESSRERKTISDVKQQ